MKSIGKVLSSVAAFGVAACGSVSGSDPSFWQPVENPGGQGFSFAKVQPAPQPQQGTGAGQSYVSPTPIGSGTPPLGAGGFPANGGAPGAGASPGGLGGMIGAGGIPAAGGIPNVGGIPSGGIPGGGGIVGGGGVPFPPPGTGGSTGPTTNSGQCTFTFNVTTVSANGAYSPRNVGAIWIEDASNKFVKTLQVWGTIRLGNATAWTGVSGNNLVDAVTGATRPNHGPLSGHWNCTDVNHNPVPDGNYQACVTFAEDDSFGFFGPPPHFDCVPFTKPGGNTTPPSQSYFTAMSTTMQ